MDPTQRARIEALLRSPLTHQRAVRGGYTPAARWIVTCRSGRSAFVKMATTPQTARALRAEIRVYTRVEGAFMPRLIAWEDDDTHPLLILEDLAGCRWPPPWDDASVAAVRDMLDCVHETVSPIERHEDLYGETRHGWEAVSADPAALIGLGIVDPDWLRAALPTLVRASRRVSAAGPTLAHFDVRSDNLCLSPRGAILVDWNLACLGNPDLDLGFWLPSLASEGGPKPWQMLPRRPDIAAFVSGFFAARAGLADVPNAPHVRRVQRTQLEAALPWAVRELELPSPA